MEEPELTPQAQLLKWALEHPALHRVSRDNGYFIEKRSIFDQLFTEGKLEQEKYMEFDAFITESGGSFGLGETIELGPPDVDFAQMGTYYRYMKIPEQKDIEYAVGSFDMSTAQSSNYDPIETLLAIRVRSHVDQVLYDGNATPAIRERIEWMLPAVMEPLGWTHNETRNRYTRPIEINRENRDAMDRMFDGGRFTARSFFQVVSEDAFNGMSYYMSPSEFRQEFRDYVAECAEEYGYTEDDGMYVPKPVELPEDIDLIGSSLLQDESYRRVSDSGRVVIPLEAIRAFLREQHDLKMSEDQIVEQLLGNQGEWRVPLILNGFGTRSVTEYGRNFEQDGMDQYSFKCIAMFRNHPDSLKDVPKAELAMGFPVEVLGAAIDVHMENLVYLHIAGSYNAVRANWSALMRDSNFKYRYQTFKVGSARNHNIFKGMLPSGVYEMIFIHHSASPLKIDPKVSFAYLISDDGDAMPSHFFATLDQLIEVPIRPEWASYLWVVGRATGMINYAGNPNKQIGPTVWKIRKGGESSNWGTIISTSLAAKEIEISE